jgi:hypothetical protein
VEGVLRVERIIDRPCASGCELGGKLPEKIDVKISGLFTVNWLVRVNAAPPAGEDNLYVAGLYTGPGDLIFNEKSYTHSGDGSTQGEVWSDNDSVTISLAPGDYPFTLSIEGAVRADGNQVLSMAAFTSTLSVDASVQGQSTFEVPCIPEPSTTGMALAGIACCFVLTKRATAVRIRRQPLMA